MLVAALPEVGSGVTITVGLLVVGIPVVMGRSLGILVVVAVGTALGETLGASLLSTVGMIVGATLGNLEGLMLGAKDGA
jgi:hypothetical protein